MTNNLLISNQASLVKLALTIQANKKNFLNEWSSLQHIFSEIESQPVQCDHIQKTDFVSIVETTQTLIDFLSKDGWVEQLNDLKYYLIALKYRVEKRNGGINPDKDNAQGLAHLMDLAIDWKTTNVLFLEKNLSSHELELLETTSKYQEFIDIISNSPQIKNDFFNWILRDKIDPLPFILYPFMTKKINESALNGRIGKFGGKDLQVITENNEKVLSLKMEGQQINILNEQLRVTFKGNYTLTIKEIFEIFKNKKFRVGNLEFMADGIINWNVHHLGAWDNDAQEFQRIDLTKQEWWQQLPTFEIISKKEAEIRYNKKLNSGAWCLAACASRGTPTLDFDQTHAFMEIAIPMNNGLYNIFDFGKFAFVFPASFFENFMTFCHTVHATVAYPDENVFYSHRQQANQAFEITPFQGQKFMDLIKEDMEQSRKNNFVFQIESENCAKWSFEKLINVLGKENVPNLFKIPLLKTEPVGFCRTLFNWVKKLPRRIQVPVLTRLHLIAGAARKTSVVENGKKVCRSLATHEFWNTGEVYLPAFLIHQKFAGVFQESAIR